MKTILALSMILWCGAVARAETLSATVANLAPPEKAGFAMGDSRRPDGAVLTIDSHSLQLDGRPWMPVMGEFHYARYPEDEWREELLKMKAGGVDICSTYVFWIHHEEIQGQFDWTGRRDLRHFVELCQQVGLKVLVRCGPWDHGEVRNGGFPDWLVQRGWKLRSNDPNYLAQVKTFYGEIARQLSGLLWKDGGPVIGIQLENEYNGPANHLLALKRLAVNAGLDVPLYTKTGWPALRTPLPFGEMIPLYGVYAEGFWDRQIIPMPDNYKNGFFFSKLRTDNAIGADILGFYKAEDAPDVARYPYLTCEIGAGMMASYHRRILSNPLDAESVALVKLGSGSASLGYYMYHGGENPDGKRTTLQESQATGYWNDMPVKNYDFQTAIGQYGQLRPQYPILRRLHLLIHAWGPELAEMPAAMPNKRPRNINDLDALRWSVRSDGVRGFIFVNNYQRLQELPPKTNVQFTINRPGGPLTFPETPVTIPSEACFIWPFNLDLGQGAQLAWATAQPLTTLDVDETRTVFFAQTKGVPTEFAFDNGGPVKAFSGRLTARNGRTIVDNVKPGMGPALELRGPQGPVRIVLLDDAASLAFWKLNWQGRDRVFLTRAGLVADGDELRLTSTDRDDLAVAVYPGPASVACDGRLLSARTEGVFQRFTARKPPRAAEEAAAEVIQTAGPPRDIPLGKISEPVAAGPEDADFAQAAVWRIKLPANLDLALNPILRLHYTGDVARVTLDGKLINDDFYNGNPMEVGLRRYAPEILHGDLRLEILPLRRDAPIMLAKKAWPHFGASQSAVSLDRIELAPRYTIQLTAQPSPNSD